MPQVSATISQPLVDKIKAEADVNGVSFSSMLELVIDRYYHYTNVNVTANIKGSDLLLSLKRAMAETQQMKPESRELTELAAWAIPYTSNCPQKKSKVDYRREKLIHKIKEYADRNNRTQRDNLPEVSE